MPKISVIIPVYNVEKYLNQCFDSVLNQTVKDIEIICVNDGSKDASSDILKEYASKDERFLVINQSNQGLSVARNNGLNAANGDYVAFLDSDDYILSNDYFEKLYNACEKYNADVSVASIIRGNDKKSDYIFKIDKEEVASSYIDKLLMCDVPDTNYVWNKLYKRESLLDTGIVFPAGRLYEDLYYTHKVLYYIDKVVSVPDVSVFYRKRSDSIVKTKNIQADIDREAGDKEIHSFFEKHGIDFSEFGKVTKKYKFLGLTIFKTVQKRDKCRNILFNLFSWVTNA